ncbi:hypothetical protein ACFY6U_38535 [Streptomyces sp. NPDC013157]|uniref:GntT/GntP/DsdX family permease n=1 Tax=Streptomyces sp. NPDC013157 TaxID=3364861 RepID=UPI0036D07067
MLLGRLIALLLSLTTGSAMVGIVSATGIVAPLIGTGGGPEASLPVIAVGSGSLGLDWRRTPLGQSALRTLRRMEVSRLHLDEMRARPEATDSVDSGRGTAARGGCPSAVTGPWFRAGRLSSGSSIGSDRSRLGH